MKVGLIGYGKMGKAIDRLAESQGIEIVFRHEGNAPPSASELKNADVCIEFTGPESAFENLKTCIDAGIPVVSGTTGWLDKKEQLEDFCRQKNGAFFYASNFSLGVNIFFTLNEHLARIMNQFSDYNVSMEEIHHTQKKDAPSGTAITLLEGLIANSDKEHWHLGHSTDDSSSIPVHVKRIDPTPGTHTITYSSMIDKIEISHTAQSRDGFALGAIAAAKWLVDKRGIFGMNDLLKLK